jgi:hypothetical protein
VQEIFQNLLYEIMDPVSQADCPRVQVTLPLLLNSQQFDTKAESLRGSYMTVGA